MITKTFNDITFHGDGEIEVNTIYTSDNIPILEENYLKKMQTNNGFSKKRELQEIAFIPYPAYLKAQQDGYDMSSNEDVDKFLKKNPEFLTSDPWVTPGSNNHRIIIK